MIQSKPPQQTKVVHENNLGMKNPRYKNSPNFKTWCSRKLYSMGGSSFSNSSFNSFSWLGLVFNSLVFKLWLSIGSFLPDFCPFWDFFVCFLFFWRWRRCLKYVEGILKINYLTAWRELWIFVQAKNVSIYLFYSKFRISLNIVSLHMYVIHIFCCFIQRNVELL